MRTIRNGLLVLRNSTISIFAAIYILLLTPASAGEVKDKQFDQTHGLYETVLSEYVKNGRVDYAGLKSSPRDLGLYLEQISGVSREEFDKWTRDEQLAFLINLYNARTLDLIQDSYPVGSIKDIASDKGGPWEQPVVKMFGDTITLNALENDVIRKNYSEPRIHFALVCAAKGCPALPDKAYLGPSLDEQLEAQTRTFLADTDKNSIDTENKTVRLSPLFEWFEEDFSSKSGSVIKFINPYFGNIAGPDYKIEYTNYDWSLNGTESSKSL